MAELKKVSVRLEERKIFEKKIETGKYKVFEID